jgi:hypothetical protein
MQLQQAHLRGKYNELILEYDEWEAALPHSVEAVFVLARSSESQREWARRIHAAFLREYSRGADETPLLLFDPGVLENQPGVSLRPFTALP